MHKVQEYLGSGDALRRLAREAARLSELDSAYRRLAPAALVEGSGVDHIDGATLILWADSGAVAAKLRQIAPRLMGLLQKHAPECTTVRVVVRISVRRISRPRQSPARIGPRGGDALRELARELPPSSLRNALTRLAARAVDTSEDGK